MVGAVCAVGIVLLRVGVVTYISHATIYLFLSFQAKHEDAGRGGGLPSARSPSPLPGHEAGRQQPPGFAAHHAQGTSGDEVAVQYRYLWFGLTNSEPMNTIL